MLFKMLIMMHLIFIWGRQNQHFQSTVLTFGREGGVTKNTTLYTLLIMLIRMDVGNTVQLHGIFEPHSRGCNNE